MALFPHRLKPGRKLLLSAQQVAHARKLLEQEELPVQITQLRYVSWRTLIELSSNISFRLLRKVGEKMTQTLKELAANFPVTLQNETCVYCSTRLDSGYTEDHVIGRRFIPKGKLASQWNLIVRACEGCNKRKADLEDDISAISMQADAWGQHATSEKFLMVEAARKARRSISRRTGKPVKDSSEQLTITIPLAPGVELTAHMTCPPQIDKNRVYELARLQMMAFFYLITYNKETRRGGFWLGSFFPVLAAIRSDWGNPIHRAFMDAVVNWTTRIIARGANGFFKAIIRRHPTAVCWSWALEWNQNYRVVGFFGDLEPAQVVARTFPALYAGTIEQGPDYYVHYREEETLEDENDNLFSVL